MTRTRKSRAATGPGADHVPLREDRSRLPPDVNRQFVASLRERLSRAPLREAARLRREERLHGEGPYSPAGLPLLEISLAPSAEPRFDAEATVGLPQSMKGASREHVLEHVVSTLRAGRTLSVYLASRIATVQRNAPAEG